MVAQRRRCLYEQPMRHFIWIIWKYHKDEFEFIRYYFRSVTFPVLSFRVLYMPNPSLISSMLFS